MSYKETLITYRDDFEVGDMLKEVFKSLHYLHPRENRLWIVTKKEYKCCYLTCLSDISPLAPYRKFYYDTICNQKSWYKLTKETENAQRIDY